MSLSQKVHDSNELPLVARGVQLSSTLSLLLQGFCASVTSGTHSEPIITPREPGDQLFILADDYHELNGLKSNYI